MPGITWRSAIQQVQDSQRHEVLSSTDLSGVPSIIQEHRASLDACHAVAPAATPRLAIMVHAALHLPGQNGKALPADGDSSSSGRGGGTHSVGSNGSLAGNTSSSSSSHYYYVKARLSSQRHVSSALLKQQEQKTDGGVVQAGGTVRWPQGLLLLQTHGRLEGLEVLLRLKRKGSLLGQPVVVGTVRVPLKSVQQSPQQWGAKQQLVLSGHKAAAAGTVLEVQMFLSASSVPSPLQVLCGTWNVGNALPPPPAQLQEWLRGAKEGEHHLVVVAAQECSYGREMRRFVIQQRRTSSTLAAAEDDPTSAAAVTTTATGVTPSNTLGLQQAQSMPPATAAAASDLQQVHSEPLGTAAAAAEAVTTHNDWLHTPQRLGSTRSVLRAKLVDAVDASGMSWERLISSALGEQYWLVRSQHMFQTRLLLFGRADMVPFISHVCSGFEATGIGHVGVNKGGVAIGLRVGATSIAFVGAHLAAHHSKVPRRNADVGEICRGVTLQDAAAVAGADLVTGFHHVVWMGDLNYRLEYGQQAATQADSPTPEDFASLCEAISQQQQSFDELLLLDQLRREREQGRVLYGFSEGHICFPPTFKVERVEGATRYEPKRSPAWCDRVLFRSLLPHKHATCERYFAAEGISTSDHKPVAAVISLPTVSTPQQRSSAVSSSPVRSGSSWSAAAAATLARFSISWHRSSIASRPTQYRLQVTSVCLSDQQTWCELAALIDRSRFGNAINRSADSNTAAAAGGVGPPSAKAVGAPNISRRSSSTALYGRRKLQLVVMGTCGTTVKHGHVMRLNTEAVSAASTAVCQPNLLLQEDSIHLHQGSLNELADDWLLVQVVLVHNWRRHQTLARGILSLQAAITAYRTHRRAVAVPLHLESSSMAVGTLMVTVRLVSCASISKVHEAVRRMKALASMKRRTPQAMVAATGSVGSLAPAADALHIDRRMSAPPCSISRVCSS